MALAPGKKLGPYEILSPLGAGGMGEVYRARDTRLDRIVALKTLPQSQTSDRDLRRRFEREARLISGLSHPHIAALFDVGHEGGMDYLVMEYLEGETLAQRLTRGALLPEETLQFGVQVADALELAHRRGVLHRDLKPSNIMLTKSGAKLLDFGLAKMRVDERSPVAVTLPYVTEDHKRVTERGVILGTFQYMAPEQLEGKEADARSDIFALGAVLYEMVTGKAAFSGKSRATLIASILTSQPTPMTALQPMTPPALDRVVKVCLAKDPDERWQQAHDVKLQLKWIAESGSQAGVPAVIARRRIKIHRFAWAVMVLGLGLAALLGMRYLRRSPTPSQQVRFNIDSDPEHSLTYLTPLALSPDGRQLVYGAMDSEGKPGLWLRRFDSLDTTRLEGSEGIYLDDLILLAWTPDNRNIVANVSGKLLRFSTSGGPTETQCQVTGQPASINESGTILLSSANSISRLDPSDCKVTPVAQESSARYEYGISWPQFLPDGKHYLASGKRRNRRHDIVLGSLDSSRAEVLVRDGTNPKFVQPGFILFSRHGYLMAQKFDAQRLRPAGDPVLVSKHKMIFADLGGWADYDASVSGVIAWKEQYDPLIAIQWYGRGGQVLSTVTESAHLINMHISPDGKFALANRLDPRTHTSDVWSLDLGDGTLKKQTFRDAPGWASNAWSHDGGRFIYSSFTANKYWEMYLKEIGTSDEGTVLQTGLAGSKVIGDWSRDEKFVVFLLETDDPNAKSGIYGQTLERGAKPFFLARSNSEDDLPRFSPDGRWISYVDDISGRFEVYVRRFNAEPSASIQISNAGGHWPRWNLDGKQLYYRTNEWKLMAVPVNGTDSLKVGKPKMLFQLPSDSEYEVSSQDRFLVSAPKGRLKSPVTVLINWQPETVASP